MIEPVIPIAFASPVVPVGPPAPTTVFPSRDLRTATTNNGGSSRVMMPTDGQEWRRLSSAGLKELTERGFTKGLAEALARNKQALPLSIWVVDNSGSMSTRDGHRIMPTPRKNEFKVLDCTRWTEMQDTVEYHAQMAAVLNSPTVFRLLNDPGRIAGPQQFSIAERGDAFIDEDLTIACSTMTNSSPGGVTPLTGHLREIHSNILALEQSLRHNGTKVVLVLATDGIPTDDRGYTSDSVKHEFTSALRKFEGLPVWIVVRLCTDEQNVVEYWNNLDVNLELSLEVLDDFTAEAKEVHAHNKWLTYGLPLHRMREMGFHDRVFDLLDERKLAKDELRGFFRVLFGHGAMDGVPEPEANWKTFIAKITELTAKEGRIWNPLTRRMEPWVDIRRLKYEYGPGWFG